MEINTGVEVQTPYEKLVDTLEYQKGLKNDWVVPAGHIHYDPLDGLLHMATEAEDYKYHITESAHQQLAAKLEIPQAYYRRMRSEYPNLLASNINGWLSKKEQTKYLLRAFHYSEEGVQNICRAILSDRYSILDNRDVLVTALQAIKETGIHVEIVKAELTEKRMYLHIIAPEIHIQAKELLEGYMEDKQANVGKGLISGVVISNSETGFGRFEISGRAMMVVCKNGLVDRNATIRKTHLGAKLNEGYVDWSEETIQKNYALILSQTKDAVKRYLSEEYLGQLTTKLLKYKETRIEHPQSVIKVVADELLIPEHNRESILRHFYRDGDESSFGMMNAFTKEAQKMDADLQHDVEANAFEMVSSFHRFDKPNSKN